MTKRSTNLDLLLETRSSIERKIFVLNDQLSGINKSIRRIENIDSEEEEHSNEKLSEKKTSRTRK